MRIVLQRVKRASVKVNGETTGKIGPGFLLLVGIGPDDEEPVLSKAADKIVNLRVFDDSAGKMNLALKDIGGEILAVSQFTLYADWRKGNRPSFTRAADPSKARRFFDRFVQLMRAKGINVEIGVFGQRMEVELINQGPVTMVMEF